MASLLVFQNLRAGHWAMVGLVLAQDHHRASVSAFSVVRCLRDLCVR